MSDQTPRPRRRRIAGETPTPAPAKATAPAPAAKKAPAKKAPAKKAPAPKAPAKDAAAKPAPVEKKAPASKVASAVAARDTGAPKPKVNRPPASKPSAPIPAIGETRPSSVPLLVSLVVLVAGVALAITGFVHWRGESFETSRESAVSFASDAAETIFSFSHDGLEEHEAKSKELMTPSFRTEYDTIAPALEDLAPQREVEVTAVVREAAALPCGVECSSSRASVLMFIDQDRRLGDDEAPTVFGNRLVVDLVKSGGDWLVDDIRAL